MNIFDYIKRFIGEKFIKIQPTVRNALILALFVILMIHVFDAISANSVQERNERKKELRGDFVDDDFKNFDKTIKQFIDYCDAGIYSEAYEMLTDECKETLYKDEKDFEENYCGNYFKSGSDYNYNFMRVDNNMAVYTVETFKVQIETGQSNEYKTRICMVKDENGDIKLNTEGLLEVENLNEEFNDLNLSIKLKQKQVHVDYEVYVLSVNNRSSESVMLNANNILFETTDDREKNADYCEINDNENNIISPNENIEAKILIKNEYTSESKIKSIILNNISKLNEKIILNII